MQKNRLTQLTISLLLPFVLAAGMFTAMNTIWDRQNKGVLAAIPRMAPPSGLVVTGPKAGSVDVTYTFMATLGAGDTPVAYTWEVTDHGAIVHNGGLSDTASFTWKTAGKKLISVTAMNGAGSVMTSYEVTIDHLPLDIVVVFDASGSMDYETNCFDCWEPYSSSHPNYDVIANPWPTNGDFNEMPNVATTALCTATPTTVAFSGGSYIVIEAELYSRDVPLHGWDFSRRVAGQGFWVIQRVDVGADEVGPESGSTTRGAYIRSHPYLTYSQSDIDNFPQLQGAAYNHECFSGPNLSGACWAQRAGQLGEAPPLSNVPWVEYDFTPSWSGTTHIWARVEGSGRYGDAWNGHSPGDNSSPFNNLPPWQKSVYWQAGPADGSNWSDVLGGEFDRVQAGNDRNPTAGNWRWLKLGSVATTQNVRQTVRLYQGTTGFSVDKILFTDYSGGTPNTTVDNWGNDSPSGSVSSAFETLLAIDSGRGPEATDGAATREACNVCNPIFGQTVDPSQCSCKSGAGDTGTPNPDYPAGGTAVGCTAVLTTTNQLLDDLYHDKDPIRSAKEAVKILAEQLDPRFDQLGLVAYSSSVQNGSGERAELQCLRWAVINGGPDGALKCYDPATNPVSYTIVIRVVEDHDNEGGTHIGQGMREGLEELGIDVTAGGYIDSSCTTGVDDGRVCDRGGTAHRILILMTDGSPNQSASCPSADNGLWQGNFGTGNSAYDCSIFYAREAALNNVTLFTIGMGPGPNADLLTAMATGVDPTTGDHYFDSVCGRYFAAAQPKELSSIMAVIAGLARSCPPNLSISKAGPAAAQAGQPLTYTLTITNHGPAPASQVTITDTVPAGATYLEGGTLMGDVVSWTLSGLLAGQVTQTTFSVTASWTITNSDYGVRAAGGFEALSANAVGTWINPLLGNPREYYLPMILK